jgi:hypothetical protein
MSVTARATIQGALKLIGVLDPAETMSPEDADDGLIMLNNIVDAWNVERLNIYTITEVVATFAGASATIGPAMTIATARPMRIESAFYRDGGLDTDLRVIEKQEYDSIPDKSSTGSPTVIFYDRNSPTGTVYVHPVPTSTEYHISVQSQLTAFTDLDDLHTLPQGYQKALMYTLAPEMALLHQRTVPPLVEKIAANCRRSLKRNNVVVPILDAVMPSNNASGWNVNILSGQ